MMDIVIWVQNNWKTISEVVAYVIAIASIIVKITPSLKDDNVLLGIIKFISKYIALNRTVDDEAVRKGSVK